MIKILSTLPEKDDDSGVALSWSAMSEELKSMMNDVQKVNNHAACSQGMRTDLV